MIIDPPNPFAPVQVWRDFVARLEKQIAELPDYYGEDDREFAAQQLERHKLTLAEKEQQTEQ